MRDFKRPHKDNSTGHLGVSFVSSRNKYQARLCVDGVRHYLGLFDDPVIAHARYLEVKADLLSDYDNPTTTSAANHDPA